MSRPLCARHCVHIQVAGPALTIWLPIPWLDVGWLLVGVDAGGITEAWAEWPGSTWRRKAARRRAARRRALPCPATEQQETDALRLPPSRTRAGVG